MIILFVVIYFLYYSFSNHYDLKTLLQNALYFAGGGLLSLMLSAWLLIPVVLELQNGKFSEEVNNVSGLLRNPFSVLRQFLPFSYGGFRPSDYPSIYCGIAVTITCLIYFFIKKISVRKKICVFFVFVFFMISFCTEQLDEMWHVFKVPNFFPSRYAFVFSFFMLLIFAETFNSFSLCKFRGCVCIKHLVLALCLLDIFLNSVFLVKSLDADEVTYKYLDRADYDTFYEQNYLISSSIDDGLFTTDYDFSHNDGLLFGLPSLDSFSSSYNLGLSKFFSSIGLNSYYNLMSDHGLTPLSASLLGVDYYIKRNSGFTPTDVSLFFDAYKNNDEITVYRNPFSFGQYYLLENFNDDRRPFGDDPFNNMNEFSYDTTGRKDVFRNCILDIKTEVNDSTSQGKYIRTVTVNPQKGEHLLFYVSAEDYFENNSFDNYDALYLNENLIALYEDNGNRYLVDLGISDGTKLVFKLLTDSKDNAIYFYSFDDEAYYAAVSKSEDAVQSHFSQTRNCLEAHIYSDKERELLLLLPYETGYHIEVDGVTTDYGSYRDAFLVLPVSEGEHSIIIKFITPGLKLGGIVSLLGLVAFIFCSLSKSKLKTINAKR